LARIFAVLAILSTLLLAANFVIGLAIGDLPSVTSRRREAAERWRQLSKAARRNETSPELEEARQEFAAADALLAAPAARKNLHMLLGVAAALLAVLVNSVTITYFIGTSRWCKEVCQTYSIRGDLADRSTRLKRSTFPWALAGILAVIGVVGLGAAADPGGANREHSVQWVTPHYVAAILGLFILLAAFWVQICRIAENYSVIEEILAEVQRIRAEKNLPTEDLAVS
jgi:hypothetical protein